MFVRDKLLFFCLTAYTCGHIVLSLLDRRKLTLKNKGLHFKGFHAKFVDGFYVCYIIEKNIFCVVFFMEILKIVHV